MADFILSKKALQDLADIWNYTYDKWSENQADKYYHSLLEGCKKICECPDSYGKDYNYILEGLKGFRVAKHIIFYKTLLTGEVFIIRFLHERMDIPNRI